jgi:hypothetical protein
MTKTRPRRLSGVKTALGTRQVRRQPGSTRSGVVDCSGITGVSSKSSCELRCRSCAYARPPLSVVKRACEEPNLVLSLGTTSSSPSRRRPHARSVVIPSVSATPSVSGPSGAITAICLRVGLTVRVLSCVARRSRRIRRRRCVPIWRCGLDGSRSAQRGLVLVGVSRARAARLGGRSCW